jgi:hypothetical protein
MPVTATYDDTTAKVTVSATGAPATSSTALFERSTDQVTWTQVRGGQAVPVASSTASIIDYEYAAGVPNYYRVTWMSTTLSAWVSTGDTSGQTASNVPSTTTIPVSGATGIGDLVGILVSLSAAPTSGTITCTTPGWTICTIGTLGALLTASYVPGLANPVVGVTVASTTSLSWYQFRYRNSVLLSAGSQVNAAATSIAVPNVIAGSGVELVLLAARAASFTAPVTPTMDFADATKGIVADHNAAFWGAPFTITFGSASSAASFEIQLWTGQAPYLLRETTSVTPNQTAAWLKNPLRPFLNRVVQVVGFDDITRQSRSGVFDVIGRTLPVAVTDLMSGRSTTITIRTTTAEEADDLDGLIAVGEVLLLHPVGGSALPTMYAVPGNTARSRVAQTSAVRRFSLPLAEVAVPDLTLAAVQSTWQTVVNTYATWADLVAAKATWNDVLQIVGSASDVITS